MPINRYPPRMEIVRTRSSLFEFSYYMAGILIEAVPFFLLKQEYMEFIFGGFFQLTTCLVPSEMNDQLIISAVGVSFYFKTKLFSEREHVPVLM